MTISNAARRLADRLHDLAHAGGHEDDVIGPLSDFIDERIAANASTSPRLDAFVAAAKRGAEPVVDVPRRNAVPTYEPKFAVYSPSGERVSVHSTWSEAGDALSGHGPGYSMLPFRPTPEERAADATEQARRSATDHREAMARLMELEAKAVVLAQAATLTHKDLSTWVHCAEREAVSMFGRNGINESKELLAALSKALEPFAELIARTK